MQITHIQKRDFSTKPFQLNKITNAILKAMTALEHGSLEDAERISQSVLDVLLKQKEKEPKYVPTVEEIQDAVEDSLMKNEFFDVAKTTREYNNQLYKNIFGQESPLKTNLNPRRKGQDLNK